MNVHADGILITAEFLSWKWYNTTTMRLLLHLALLSMESDNGTVKVSLRSLAVSLRVSYKEIRTAFRHLQEEGVVSLSTTTTHTIVHFEPWSNIDECFVVQWAHEGRTRGAQTPLETNELSGVGAHEGRTKGARLKNFDTIGRTKGAQTTLEINELDGVGAHEGRTNCKDISYIEKRAHENLEEGAQTLLETNELEGVGAHEKNKKGARKKVSPLCPSSFPPTTPISTPPIPPSQNEKKKNA